MKTLVAEPLFNVQNDLGEGPLWHPFENCLYWVDIDAGMLFRSDPGLTGYTTTRFDTPLGAFGFHRDGGMILATGMGFLHWAGGKAEPENLWNPLPDRAGVRLNDGKVDPAGRFWAGSIDTDQCQGALYRLDPDGTKQTMLDQIGISNGLDWLPDQKTMFYTDSYRSTIYAFDYDHSTGAISQQRPFVSLPETNDDIVPDGLCIDAEGCVWSAQWNGWQVVRYDPQGTPIQKVTVPAQRVTSCCFGGKNGDLLFITTARTSLSKDLLAVQPHAGDVFVCQTDTQGQGTTFFG